MKTNHHARSRRMLRSMGLGLVALIVATAFVGPLGTIIGIIIAVPFVLAALEELDEPEPKLFAQCVPIRHGPTLLQLTAPKGACALCMSSDRTLFATPRLVICEKCVWAVRDGPAYETDELQRQVELFVRTALRDQTIIEIEPLLRLALDGGFRVDQLDRYMQLMFDKDWRAHLRAYHFGLVSYPDVASRPSAQAWDALAHSVRLQDGVRCNVCGARNTAMHVHHIIPLSEGGTNDARNLVTLCHDCHLDQHPGGSFSRPDPLEAITAQI